MEISGVINLRDVGGQLVRPVGSRATTASTVRTDALFRSGQLGPSDDAAVEALRTLGVTVVFDLRTTAEVELLADRVPDGVDVRHLDVLAGSDSSVASHLTELFSDTTAAEQLLRSGDIETHYLGTYRSLVTLDSARDAYRALFAALADHDGAALFHCTAGKDRTGWAAAALLTLLGVDDDTITRDYLRSSEPVVESFRPLIDQFAEAGGDPALLIPVFCVEPAYLDAARAEMTRTYGTIEGYFSDGLGLGPAVQARLRQRWLVNPR